MQLSIRNVDDKTAARLDVAADKRGISREQYVRQMLELMADEDFVTVVGEVQMKPPPKGAPALQLVVVKVGNRYELRNAADMVKD